MYMYMHMHVLHVTWKDTCTYKVIIIQRMHVHAIIASIHTIAQAELDEKTLSYFPSD